MNFNFGEVLTRAWQIIWKHKVLWIFGILASCGRGGSNFNSNNSGNGGDNGFGSTTDLPPQFLRWFQTIQDNLTTFIVIGIAVICLIWIVTIFLGTIGKIGLIRGTVQAEGGAESLIFGELFSGSIPYFWRMFGLSLILALPAFVGGMAVIVMGLAGGETAVILLIPVVITCLCFLIPVMFVIGMIFRQAENAIVLEEMGLLPSISRGWDVFKSNLGPVILMAIILAVIGFVAVLIALIPFMIVVIPAVVAFTASQGQNATPLTPLIPIGVCICLYIPVLLLLRGIMIAYVESAWTLTYLRLTRKPQIDSTIVEANA